MRNRRLVAGVTVWVAAVATVAGLAWFAIDSAGRQVTALSASADSPLPGVSDEELGVGTPTGSDPEQSEEPTAEPSPTPEPGGGDPDESGKPTRESARTVYGSRSTSGGRVSVSCTGTRIRFNVVPVNGWRADVDPGSSRVDARFRSSTREIEVLAACASGAPRFTVDVKDRSSGKGGDDDNSGKGGGD